MLGFRSTSRKEQQSSSPANDDVAKLFFDSFSRRVGEVEGSLRVVTSELEKLRSSIDRGQISDLVLLDRVKRAEDLVRQSVLAINASITEAIQTPVSKLERSTQLNITPEVRDPDASLLDTTPLRSLRMSPAIGEIGSLPSITTPTELQVLTLLATEGPKSAPEIGRAVARSREHTARLMKKLYQEGYIRRDQTRIPFKYSAVEKVKQVFEKRVVKDEEKEALSVPQT